MADPLTLAALGAAGGGRASRPAQQITQRTDVRTITDQAVSQAVNISHIGSRAPLSLQEEIAGTTFIPPYQPKSGSFPISSEGETLRNQSALPFDLPSAGVGLGLALAVGVLIFAAVSFK